MNARNLTLQVLALALAGLGGCDRGPDAGTVSYRQDVQPILDNYCAECHTGEGAGLEASGFSVASYEAVMRGTKFGAMVEPGDPLSSSLYRLVSGREIHPSIRMPHGQAGLTEAEIAVIESWISQGAKDD